VNFSYNWLREMVDVSSVSPAELTGLITIKTAECDGVHPYAPHLSSVRTARVLSAEPIEGSKNIKAVVDVRNLGTRTVVCGAPNCRPGIVTVYVPAGTMLNGKEIRKATIGGVESDGMLASGDELSSIRPWPLSRTESRRSRSKFRISTYVRGIALWLMRT
jgi:phenylalanyl-tRNA synthetase beta chain